MRILVLNCGSSSIKLQLYDAERAAPTSHGIVARIGEPGSYLELSGPRGRWREERAIASHAEGLEALVQALLGPETGALSSLDEIGAVGHRAVHGGDLFVESVLITDEVLAKLEECVPLAPLHNPANLVGMREARRLFPAVPQVAVFDTTFHQTMPPRAYRYAIPTPYYERHRLRRYGFHGTSFRYVSARAAALLERDLADLRMVVCHLGNGCSVAAVEGGRSVDTSMGMTPLEGLVMGTRSGDIDPGVVLYLIRELGLSVAGADRLLNDESGLLGLSGAGNDMRLITQRAEEGDAACALALDVFTYRVKKYIGAYAAAMGGLDALVFTAGIGENSAPVRRQICAGLSFLRIEIDEDLNRQAHGVERDISSLGADVRVLVIPTDEERMIAEDTLRLASVVTARRSE